MLIQSLLAKTWTEIRWVLVSDTRTPCTDLFPCFESIDLIDGLDNVQTLGLSYIALGDEKAYFRHQGISSDNIFRK